MWVRTKGEDPRPHRHQTIELPVLPSSNRIQTAYPRMRTLRREKPRKIAHRRERESLQIQKSVSSLNPSNP
jgi:hypothetical protein